MPGIRELATTMRRAAGRVGGIARQSIQRELQKTNEILKREFSIDSGKARSHFRLVSSGEVFQIINAATSKKGFNYPWHVLLKGKMSAKEIFTTGSKRPKEYLVLPPIVEREEKRLKRDIEAKITLELEGILK